MAIFAQLSPEFRKNLLPFVVTCLLYFLQPYGENTFKGAIFKCLPIASLIGFVISTKTNVMHKTTTLQGKDFKPSDPYTYFILLGLVTSLFSDLLCGMLPVVMVIGTLLFTVTHFCYFLAISASGRHTGQPSRTTWMFILTYIDIFLLFQVEFELRIVKVLFAIYLAPLFLVTWKASAAYEHGAGGRSALYGLIGAALLLGLETAELAALKWSLVPSPESLFSLVYFTAQLFWTISVIDVDK